MLLNAAQSPLGPLKTRVAMAAMTRSFCGPNHTATDAMANYYGTRAEDGVALILTEGTVIHPHADGYNDVPYIQTAEQTDSWRKVVQRVQKAGSKIICQLWHCGRISHEDYTGGVPPLCSVAVAAEGMNRQNNKPFGTPRAMTLEDFPIVYEQYVQAARNAIYAGFDAVQMHLGHGYLADQFFDARINTRTDQYGGSVENRCRFALEATKAVIDAIGADKVMVRISPSRDMGGIYDWPDMDAMLAYLIPALDALGLRMLDISCARADYYQTSGRVIRMIRSHWPHFLIGGASLTQEQAEKEIADGYVDMVTWGRHLIANPDLVSRFKNGTPLTEFDIPMLKSLA